MKKAFTLAEVLITLTIIGVIAAMTIPNLMRKWEDQHTVSAVKEAYSILNNAFKIAIAENGPFLDWDWPRPNTAYDIENSLYLGDILKKYLKVSKYEIHQLGHTYTIEYFKQKNLNNTEISGGSAFNTHGQYGARLQLSNGMNVLIGRFSFTGYGVDYDAPIYVDINGSKGPNRYGYDIFVFGSSTTTSLNPYGGKGMMGADYCSMFRAGDQNGVSCAYWILKHGNTDYKYRDVSSEW